MPTGTRRKAWGDVLGPRQFSVGGLIELLSACAVFLATSRVGELFGCAVAFTIVAVWSNRVRDWRVRISLMMLLGGIAGLCMGLCFVAWAFQLSPWILEAHRLPDVLAVLGPILALSGVFYGLFGFLHLIVALARPHSLRRP